MLRALCCSFALLVFSLFLGCGKGDTPSSGEEGGLDRVRLQADWYAQIEQGGFYQAIAKGIYAKHGIDLELIEASPGVPMMQIVARGDADFGMGRLDTLVQGVAKGLPMSLVTATMRHDPSVFMVRADSDVHTFKDLDGKRVMLGISTPYEAYFREHYDIDFHSVPFAGGYGEFLIDPELVLKAYIGNEPFFVRREGVEVRVLPFYESGFDAIRTVFVNNRYAAEHPDITRRFVAATIEGWKDFLENDPQPGIELVLKANPKLDPEHVAYAYKILKEEGYFTGVYEDWVYGSLPAGPIDNLVNIMRDLEVIPAEFTSAQLVDRSFLPEGLQGE